MAVLFLDTDSELWYSTARELGFEMIKMPYTIDGQEYFFDAGETTDFKGFYERMREGAVPITSALNAENYKEILEPFFAKGEQMLYIAFSSQMSGTFQQYETAVKELKEKYPAASIIRYDTLNISMGTGIMCYLAGKFFKQSGSIEKTVEYLDTIIKKVAVRFVVDDMVYLKRGGRISAAKAAFGAVFKIKPVLKVTNEGKLDVCAKLTGAGSKKAFNYLVEEIKNNLDASSDAPVIIVNADIAEPAHEIADKVRELFPGKDVWEQPVGPVIGAHCGPGTIGVIFMSTKR